MKYQHFFWDFDGTLYDTYGRITRAAANALGDLGVKLTADEVFPVAKRSLFAVCAKWAEPLGYTYDRFLEIYHRHSEQEGAESIRPFPGSLETLREVVERGGKNYLYTHRNNTARWYLETYGLAPYFSDMVASVAMSLFNMVANI